MLCRERAKWRANCGHNNPIASWLYTRTLKKMVVRKKMEQTKKVVEQKNGTPGPKARDCAPCDWCFCNRYIPWRALELAQGCARFSAAVFLENGKGANYCKTRTLYFPEALDQILFSEITLFGNIGNTTVCDLNAIYGNIGIIIRMIHGQFFPSDLPKGGKGWYELFTNSGLKRGKNGEQKNVICVLSHEADEGGVAEVGEHLSHNNARTSPDTCGGQHHYGCSRTATRSHYLQGIMNK